jgi:isopentenyl diphosphate isomerase/L-lactate dehydrogenase-like FMN-dependent dehydrogenase
VTTFKYRLYSHQEPITVEDYRDLARRKVPDMVWAYVDYGAEDLTTMESNREAFGQYAFRTRVLTGNEASDLSVEVAGAKLSLPVLLAPTGVVGLSHWTGELGAAQGAERAGTLSILSTAASYSIEEVANGTEQDHFFQLYPWADLAMGARELTESFIERAQNNNYRALFVTVDVPVHGNRESERKRGMGVPPTLTPRRILNAARRPKWTYNYVHHGRMTAKLLSDVTGAKGAVESLQRQIKFMRPELDWSDFAWMREHWKGPLFIKGVLDQDDAARAVDLGADGVVVSNHGGRQLEGAAASLNALPAIAHRVGDQAQVLLDGGVRRGSDVVKALCLGASAVCIGRPYLYGIAARGPAGVEHILQIFQQEISRTLTLMGVGDVKELDETWLLPSHGPIPY